MERKNPKRRADIARLMSLLLALCMTLCTSGCGKDDDWLEADGAQNQTQTQQQTDDTGFEGEFSAPVFKSGAYTLTAVTSNATDYTDENGNIAQSGAQGSTYVYDLNIFCAQDEVTASYTFKHIKLTSTVNGKESVILDTETGEKLTENYSPYISLIGQSFEVKADSHGNITAINGIDTIKSEKPDAAELVNEDDLKTMALEVFHPIPDTFAYGTKWTQTFYESENTYTVSKLSRGLFGITVVSEQPETYSYSDDSQGTKVTFNCTDITPTVGQLWMDQNDRALQELSTYQRSIGTLSYDDYGETFSYVNSISSTTTITAK